MCELAVPRTPANLATVIRFVQEAEGNRPCFGEGRGCAAHQCAWRSLCEPAVAERSLEAGASVPTRGRAWLLLRGCSG